MDRDRPSTSMWTYSDSVSGVPRHISVTSIRPSYKGPCIIHAAIYILLFATITVIPVSDSRLSGGQPRRPESIIVDAQGLALACGLLMPALNAGRFKSPTSSMLRLLRNMCGVAPSGSMAAPCKHTHRPPYTCTRIHTVITATQHRWCGVLDFCQVKMWCSSLGAN